MTISDLVKTKTNGNLAIGFPSCIYNSIVSSVFARFKKEHGIGEK